MAPKDVVIIGAGHNGLVAAAYLAKAGRSVLVLERRDEVGGVAASEELAPGFRCAATFPSAETFDSTIATELGLEGHGLRWLDPGGILVPRVGEAPFFLPPPAGDDPAPTAAAIAGVSAADGEAYAAFDAFIRRLATVFAPILANPLPALEPHGPGGYLALLRTALRLRRLGAKDLAAVMRFLPMPVADVVDDYFETPALKAAVAASGITAAWLGPRSPGSAFNLLLHRCGRGRGGLGFPHFTAGGTAALCDALAAAARAAGAEIRTAAEVAAITLDGGRVRGVTLTSGEEIAASTVASAADPKHTFFSLLDAAHLEPGFLHAVRSIRSRGTVGLVHYALDGLPAFTGVDESEQLAGRIQIGSHPDDLERAFDATKYGRLPAHPYLSLTIPTLRDPDLAPAGKHVLSAWVQYPPYDLREGSWEEEREVFGDLVSAEIAHHAPGFGDLVTARQVRTPHDLERRYGVTGGCLYHVEPALDQVLYLRPLPRWAYYATPIAGLYLCGAGTHGGGGLTGLPGRNAARRILRT